MTRPRALAVASTGASLALALAIAVPALALPGIPDPPVPEGVRLEDGKRSINKAGPEVKFVASGNYSGLLYGARASRFLIHGFYAGILAYGDVPLLGRELAPGFGYAGLLTGYELKVAPMLGVDANFHAGLLRNGSATVVDGWQNSLAFEPSLSVWTPVPLVKGARVALSAGYLMAPFADGVSGVTVGFHVDFKTFEVKFDLD